MRKAVAAALVALLLATPGVSWARASQGARPAQAPAPPQQPQAGSQPLPQPADLGIDLNRIRRELREIPPVASNLLRYDFHVDVYGQNPQVDFFKDFDLSPNGAVRYGGMTHAEFLNVVTPQAYRAPSADLIGFAAWAVQQLSKKKLNDNTDKIPDK